MNLDLNKSYIQKRNGKYQEIDYSKIQNRLKYLAIGYPDKVNYFQLSKLENISKNTNNLMPYKNVEDSQIQLKSL